MGVLGVLVGEGGGGELEIGEVEARGYGATRQGVGAARGNTGTEPGTSLDDGKGQGIGLSAEEMGVQDAIGCDLEDMEGVAGVMVPELIRRDAVEGGELAGLQQEVNAGHGGARAIMERCKGALWEGEGGAVNFAEGTAFGVRSEVKALFPVLCVHNEFASLFVGVKIA